MPFADCPEGRIFYEVIDVVPPWVADPQTIVFHHGVSTTSGIWSDWIPVLGDRYRIVRFDMIGFGRSAVPAAGFGWSFDVLVDNLMAVASSAGVTAFHLAGESIGGTAALAAALKHPDRVTSLTLSNCTDRGPAVQNVRGHWDQRIARDGQDAWATEMMAWRFFPDALTEEKYRWFESEHTNCSPEATLAIADLLLRTDLTDQVGAIRMPVLLLSPDSSPFVPVEVMAELHGRLPDAEFQAFAHARHGLPLSHGRECAQAMSEFLNRRFPRQQQGIPSKSA